MTTGISSFESREIYMNSKKIEEEYIKNYGTSPALPFGAWTYPYAGYYSDVINSNYKYSANITQTLVAFFEAILFAGGRMSSKVALAAIIFISTFVPPSGLLGYYGPNEKLMETLVATVLTSFLITPVYGGSYSKNAIYGFMLSTSSAGFTEAGYSWYYGL
jgi:hypothetical protein